jgi:3-deoxy-manno-octulosonate cytidylyltransferase (CMP-KDO synthetase)
MKYIGIIPARYASTRFPGKPLVEINGKSMIQRVYEQAVKCPVLDHVVVATDDERIFNHAKTFGQVVYTSENHPSGTDRCFEAAQTLQDELSIRDEDIIINIQGDEPFIQPRQIEELCSCFQNPETQIATLIKKIDSQQPVFDPNVVKVVTDKSGRALYFSRSPIPFFRGKEQEQWINEADYYRHIGMYAYKLMALEKITRLPVSSLERAESLEQLRWIENGFFVQTSITEFDSLAVDTPADLEKIKASL